VIYEINVGLILLMLIFIGIKECFNAVRGKTEPLSKETREWMATVPDKEEKE